MWADGRQDFGKWLMQLLSPGLFFLSVSCQGRLYSDRQKLLRYLFDKIVEKIKIRLLLPGVIYDMNELPVFVYFSVHFPHFVVILTVLAVRL